MKNLSFRKLLTSVSSLLLLSLSSYSFSEPQLNDSSNAKELLVGWEIWYPFQYRNQQQQLVGVDFEILQAILAQAKFTASYTEIPWKRHLAYIKSGDIDIAMGASITEDRKSYSYFSDDYREEKIGLIVRKNTLSQLNLNNLADLKNLEFTLGVEPGYDYGVEYSQLKQDPLFTKRLIEVFDIEHGINMLVKGRIDGILADPITIAAFEEKYQLYNMLEMHPLAIYQYKVHLMLSRKSFNENEVELINNAISNLKESGELQIIIDKYTRF